MQALEVIRPVSCRIFVRGVVYQPRFEVYIRFTTALSQLGQGEIHQATSCNYGFGKIVIEAFLHLLGLGLTRFHTCRSEALSISCGTCYYAVAGTAQKPPNETADWKQFI